MSRKPLNSELRWKARASLYPIAFESEDGKRIKNSLPSSGESDQHYLERVSQLEPAGTSRLINPVIEAWKKQQLDGLEFAKSIGELTDREERIRKRAIDLKAHVLDRLDVLADSWIGIAEQFLAAAQEAKPEELESLLAQGAPVNYHDPRNGATALHYVAAQGARPAFRVLLKARQINFLARDNKGRLASLLAGTSGRDLAMERLLLRKEIEQALTTGVPLDQIYKRILPSREPVIPVP